MVSSITDDVKKRKVHIQKIVQAFFEAISAWSALVSHWLTTSNERNMIAAFGTDRRRWMGIPR